MVRLQTNTQGSDEDCANPHWISHRKRERCQRRPACAMPYTGLTIRHTRVLPSDPVVLYPGGGWQYTTSPGSSSPCKYAATKSHRRMDRLRRAAREASTRREVARM
eukprot:890536-Pleurochrysis_carterae.AAC.1